MLKSYIYSPLQNTWSYLPQKFHTSKGKQNQTFRRDQTWKILPPKKDCSEIHLHMKPEDFNESLKITYNYSLHYLSRNNMPYY